MSEEARFGQDPAISAGFHHDEPSPAHQPEDPLDVNLHDMPIPGLDGEGGRRPVSFASDGPPAAPASSASPGPTDEVSPVSAGVDAPSAPAAPSNIPRLEDVLLPEGSEQRSRRDRRRAEQEAAAAAEFAAQHTGGVPTAGAPAIEPDVSAAPPATPEAGFDAAPSAYAPDAYQPDATLPPAQPYAPVSAEAPPYAPSDAPAAFDAPPVTPDFGAPAPDFGAAAPDLPQPELGAPPADLPPPSFDAGTPASPFASDDPVAPEGAGEPEFGLAPPAREDAVGEPSPFSIEQPEVAPVADPAPGELGPDNAAAEFTGIEPGLGEPAQDSAITAGYVGEFAPGEAAPAPAPGFGQGFDAVPSLEEDPEPPPAPPAAAPTYEDMPPPAFDDGSQWGAPPQQQDAADWNSPGWEAAGAQAIGSVGADPDFQGYSPQAFEMAAPPPPPPDASPVPDEDEIEAEVTTSAFSELSSLAVERPKVERTRAGLTKRDNVPASAEGLGDGSIKPADRDADAVRSRYTSFYSGTTRAKADAVQSGQKVPGHAGSEA